MSEVGYCHMKRPRHILALTLIGVALAACSGGSPSSGTWSCTRGCARSPPAPTVSGNATPLSANNRLTGFGATHASWDAHHKADPDPNLDAGCCYGPRIDTVDQPGAD